jgi:hypothetical protein
MRPRPGWSLVRFDTALALSNRSEGFKGLPGVFPGGEGC